MGACAHVCKMLVFVWKGTYAHHVCRGQKSILTSCIRTQSTSPPLVLFICLVFFFFFETVSQWYLVLTDKDRLARELPEFFCFCLTIDGVTGTASFLPRVENLKSHVDACEAMMLPAEPPIGNNYCLC